MIDHISLSVQNLAKALEFYKAALAPLGYEVLMEFPGTAGLGAGGKPDLWIMETTKATHPAHIAITGARSHIHDFHAAALAAGGTDNGAPGPRADYHPHYYAAFILDPEGNNIEVVSHLPEGVEESPRAEKAPRKPRKPASSVKKTLGSKPMTKTSKTSKASKASTMSKVKAAAKRNKPTAAVAKKAPAKKAGKGVARKRR